ncbi:sialate O-acetylesterase [Olivibacter sp. XZL3]|uniref:sialate O-acetylesterase n=1 Tax=Olivibacter sp. XZL3 TaxID=1735116 RepID=UPI001064C616|nr:sialate O-acetylesterase [Olivibacter sp. XZL3]
MSLIKSFLAFVALCFLAGQSNFAQIRLPALIGDSMVLQRDVPLNLWGWASPGEKVKVVFRGKSASATADGQGKWKLTLPAMKAGGPDNLHLEGKNKLTLKGVLVGDVWLCAGQSNMVHQMRLHNITYADDIAQADFSEIRQFWVPTATSLDGPRETLKPSTWKWANAENVKDFSAVAYFFAKAIYQRHHIPIGIINSSVGGTPIEAWTSEEGLKEFPSVLSVIGRNKNTDYIKSIKKGSLENKNLPLQPDKGLLTEQKWFNPDYKPKGWRTINVPGYWEDQGIRDLNGVVWYRREVVVPESLAGKGGMLFLGRIVDADQVYINGVEVGQTSYQYPQRRYQVPSGLLKAGTNLIVVRVENVAGKGGFVPDKPYSLLIDNQSIDLKGYWQYKVGQVHRPIEQSIEQGNFNEQHQPTALYNAMIAPFTHYNLRGILWYQGESNVDHAEDYEKLLPALIHDWRSQFSNPNLPFYYVQLPNYGDANYLPLQSAWAVVREAAFKTLNLPHTGMAVTIDLGEWNDIHPDNKKGVGDRLSLIARRLSYGEQDLVYSGPLYQSAEVKGNKIIINFSHTGSGLIAIDGEELSEFAIAGADKKFVWAKAKVSGNSVEIWSDEVDQPKYVRYAWADNPVNPNLYNVEGLPASPFRTDGQTDDLQ